MRIYIFLLIFLLCTLLCKKIILRFGNTQIELPFLLSCFALFLFAALRAVSVGADTRQYQIIFQLCQKEKWLSLYNSQASYLWFNLADIEIGYKFYNKILSCICSSPQTIIISNSFLQIFLIGIVILKYSKNRWLSIFLYYTFCFYQTALNLSPSSIVSYYMILLISFIDKKKLYKFLLGSIFGILFHNAAVFFIPLYFLCKIKLNKKRIVWILLLIIAAIIFYERILLILVNFIPANYVWYIVGKAAKKKGLYELAVYLIQLLAVLLCFGLLEKTMKEEFIEENNIEIWLFLIETMAYMFSVKAANFIRGAFLFSPIVIILIPQILSNITNKKKKTLATGMIILYGVFVYILRILVNNVGTTMPYVFA